MLQYLVILLDDTAASFCHYNNTKTERRLISLEHLKEGIFFAMKHNLMIQFVYPTYELPPGYDTLIESIDHHNIMPVNGKTGKADVIILDAGNTPVPNYVFAKDKTYALRTGKTGFFANYDEVALLLTRVMRLNIVITDVDTFTEQDFIEYEKILNLLTATIKELYNKGIGVQFNLLTDRILLDKMNNCNAGIENITLAPNGKFYICPAFYLEDESGDVGNLDAGITIKNKQLYQLQYAPLCRSCDAFQCKRCIWLNRRTTLEVNTPSHEQCVIAHIERKASRLLLNDLQALGIFTGKEIKKIDYLDPFEIKDNF